MRCRFASPDDAADQRALADFDRRSRAFFELLPHAAGTAHLEEALLRVDEDFEIVSVHRQDQQLAVRSAVERRPRLQRFAAQAPASIAVSTQWSARPFPEALAVVKQRTGFDMAEARVRAGITRGHLLELLVYLHGAAGSSDERAQSAAELAVESCLGERIVDDWVVSIDAAPLPRGGPLKLVQASDPIDRTFPLSELRSTIERSTRAIRDGLAPQPLWQQPAGADWVLLEAEPHGSCVAAQEDLLFASTFLPEMLKCYLQDAPFSSLRFARHGERFAYLKYASGGALGIRVQTRQVLEDALDQALRSESLGCVVGNGVGRAHCYVDLALAEVDGALRIVCDTARRLGLPRTSWVLFCDSEWQLEWVGVWDETPPPPER